MRDESGEMMSRVDSSLVIMAQAVREAMRQAGAALLAADPTLAQQVIVRDEEIHTLRRVVEDRVYDRPSSPAELRMTMTALQVASDLERMGDLAAHVARATLRRQPAPAVGPELTPLFRAMGTVADGLAGKIVAALADRDPVLAGQVEGDDDAMDELHRQLFAVMLSPNWPLGVEAAIDGALLGRFYERYADHAVNVGHHVIYLVTGKKSG